VLFVLCAGAGLVGVRAAAKLRDSRGLPPEAPLPSGAGWADGDQPGGHG